MGRVSVTSETTFNYPAEVIYDYVTNPENWGKTYKGSGGLKENEHLELPLKFGDVFTEKVVLENNTYHSKWTLITAIRPRRWVFQQVDDIGKRADGTGGVKGTCTISYSFESTGHGVTLFTRNLTLDLPKGVRMPDDLLTVCARPDGIDRYHAAIEEQLDKAGSQGS
ncbi:hypothetical protein BDV18DRAFT_142180 [Aspergillus unguis]